MKHAITSWTDPFFAPMARHLYNLGIRANHITVAQGLPLGVFAAAMLLDELTLAIAGLATMLMLDVADGAWARATDTVTRNGHLLDKAMDLAGIYTFLAVTAAWMPPLAVVNIAVAGVVAALYWLNELAGPEVYCGVRSVGLLGLVLHLFWGAGMLYPMLLTLAIGAALVAYKAARLPLAVGGEADG